MLRLIIFLTLLPVPAVAASTVSDAFGILPADALTRERAAWAGLRTGERSGSVLPNSPESLFVFVGPKSLGAGKDEGHAVALALDRHGNLVADGLTVTFRLGNAEEDGKRTRNGISSVEFTPAPKAQTYAAGARIGDRQSPRALFRVTADLESARPELAQLPEADIETVVTVMTQDIADRFGNRVEDGVSLSMIIDHDDGTHSLTTPIVTDGRAKSDLLIRGMTSGGQIRTALAGNTAPASPLIVKSLERETATDVVLWSVPELDALGMRVGPILTGSGHLLTDGSPVVVEVTTRAGTSARSEGWARDGVFETLLPISADLGPFDLAIETPLGLETRRVEPSEAPQPIRGAE